MTEKDQQALMLWNEMHNMTDQQVRDVVEMFPEYFKLEEKKVSFDYDEWLKAVE